jgi:transposase
MNLYFGIDWSEKHHDVAVVNAAGATIAHLRFGHKELHQLERLRQQFDIQAQDCLVALETAHNLIIDYLWAHEYQQVYVVPPHVVKSSRGRYRQTGAHTDQTDASLLANLLRTDKHRLQPWRPDSLLTQQLRAKVSLYRHLTQSITRLSNRLRAVLLRYYPAALTVFSTLDSPITLAFIRQFPTPDSAANLSLPAFRSFAQAHHYPQPKQLVRRYARLQAAQPQASTAAVASYEAEARLLADLLLAQVAAKKQTVRELKSLFGQHPDQAIYHSLPGVGPYLAPALLVKFGEDRQRFPTASSVQALAGTCPVTEQSGQRRRIKFRRACDKAFRDIVQQWAWHSLEQSVWANAYYEQVRARGHHKAHALRCLGNRWLAILWKLWQSGQPYDEAYHLQQHALRRRPK